MRDRIAGRSVTISRLILGKFNKVSKRPMFYKHMEASRSNIDMTTKNRFSILCFCYFKRTNIIQTYNGKKTMFFNIN